jgi:hypothetical protein
MIIESAKLQENSVLINGVHTLPDSNTGHIRTTYNKWLAQGNTPEPMDIIDPWPKIRSERDNKIIAVQFEYDRNARELRLSAAVTRPTEWMALLDQYVQDLADIPQTYKLTPDDIIWPKLP